MTRYAALLGAALRVLMAVAIDHVEPNTADVDELRRLAPDCRGYELDDLACEVIKRATQQRARERGVVKV